MGDKFASAELNQLDADHAISLDKSVAGDTLAGVVSLAAGAAIKSNNGYISADASHGIRASIASGISPGVAGGIAGDVDSGIVLSATRAIRSQVVSGIQGEVTGAIIAIASGGILGNVAKGIQAGIADGIDADVAGGIQSSVVGGFRLAGGASDWVTFSAARSRDNTARVIQPDVLSTGWTGGWGASGYAPGIVGPGTTVPQRIPLTKLHDGATMSQLTIVFAVAGAHAGGEPAFYPTFEVYALLLSNGSSPTAALALSTSASQAFPSAGSGAAWYDLGKIQSFNYSCNQNNVIDQSRYVYVLVITDENGANSASGNFYIATEPTYSAIANMAFP